MNRSSLALGCAIFGAAVIIACGSSSKRDGFGDGTDQNGTFDEGGSFDDASADAIGVTRDPTTPR